MCEDKRTTVQVTCRAGALIGGLFADGMPKFAQAEYGNTPPLALRGKLGHREDVLYFDLPTKP